MAQGTSILFQTREHSFGLDSLDRKEALSGSEVTPLGLLRTTRSTIREVEEEQRDEGMSEGTHI